MSFFMMDFNQQVLTRNHINRVSNCLKRMRFFYLLIYVFTKMHAKKREGSDFSVDDLVNSINFDKKRRKGEEKK